MANATETLASTVNLARTHIDLMPLADVGGYTNEPALSLCKDVMSELLTSPNDWKFNRNEMTILVTALNKQDYLFAGASAFTIGANGTGAAVGLASGAAISASGTTITVNTLEAHRFQVGNTVFMTGNTVGSYNSTYSDNGTVSGWSGGWVITLIPSPTQFEFTHATSDLPNSGAPGILNYGWLCRASMVQMSNTSSPQAVRQLETTKELPVWSRVADPEKVSIITDNGDGTIKVRFYFVPGGTIWGAKLIYQAKPPLKTALSDTWAPIPDHYSALYRQAFLYRAYRYLNSPRAEVEYAKLQQEVARAQGADDNEQTDVYVTPSEPLMDNSGFYGGW